MNEFYHGPRVSDQETNLITITGANVSIVGVVGTAPIFMLSEENQRINEPFLINNYSDKSKYIGQNVEGYTLGDAIETILTESGGAKIYCVNVFDPSKHKAELTTIKKFIAGKITLVEPGILNLTVKKGEEVLNPLVDYNFSDNIVSVISDKLAQDDEVTLTYTYADLSKVGAAEIIGAVDEFGKKTGMKALEDVESIFGDQIGILICPSYDGLTSVRMALETLNNELESYTYFDAPIGTTKEEAIKGRAEKGTINFNTVNKSSMPLFPYVGRYNANAEEKIKPLSPVVAGLRVKLDRERGIQKSISNTVSKTITKTDIPISFRIGKYNTDANDLNSKGITTVINKGGFRIFGNHSANYPSSAGIETFECVTRVDKFIKKSILNSTMNMVDEPITGGLIDSVVNAGNAFLDDLKNPAVQTIIDGYFWYDSSLNSVERLQKGWTRFCYKFVAPPPNEDMEFMRYIDIQLLKNIGGNAA